MAGAYTKGKTDGMIWAAADTAADETAINNTMIRDALVNRPAVGGEVGSMFFDTTNDRLYFWDGGAWRSFKPYAQMGIPNALTTSGTTEYTINGAVIPDQGCSGRLNVNAMVRVTGSTVGDRFEVRIKNASTSLESYHEVKITDAGIGTAYGIPCAQFAMAAGASKYVSVTIQRIAGTGTAAIDNTTYNNKLTVVFIPD